MVSMELQRTATSNPKAITIQRLLQQGTGFLSQMGVESARLDAELLLGKVVGCGREELYLNYEMPLKAKEKDLFQRALQRRARREPVSYITGHREFWSLDFLLTADVLVPRPETELLVEVVLGLIEAESQMADCKLQILDLGTGSGAIAVSLAKERSDVEIWATDLFPGALEIARANAARHGVNERTRFLQGDVFEPVEGWGGFFHMIVSNPPYVCRGEIQDLPPEVRDWEPRSAWDGGWDGLDLLRRIIQDGHLYLKEKGFMALEIGADMGEKVCRLIEGVGCYSEGSVYQDLAGRDRLVVTRKLPRPNK
jgi:release factor glutamine methyltransferase